MNVHVMGSFIETPYLEGQGDSVSSFIRGIAAVKIWVITVINRARKMMSLKNSKKRDLPKP